MPARMGKDQNFWELNSEGVLHYMRTEYTLDQRPSLFDMDMLEWVQHRSTKMIQELEHLTYQEKLGELGFFSLEKRGFRVESMCVNVYQHV